MRHLTLTVTLLFSVAVIIGCGQRKTPSDLPMLYPCTITVIQDGKPLEGATVNLLNIDTAAKYAAASGQTKADGTAAMRCYGQDGAPEGEYKITVQKVISEGGEEYKDASGLPQVRNEKHYETVAEPFSDTAKTPLTLTLTTGKNEQSVDVGKAVKIEQKNEYGR